MQTYQNKKISIKTSIGIIILVIIGSVFYYYKTRSMITAEPTPVVCAAGDNYNILTGKPCPSNTTASSSEGASPVSALQE